MKKRGLYFLALGLVAVLCVLFYKSNYEVPILMYHHVDVVPKGSSVHVSPEAFERQMEFLKIHSYRVIPLADLVEKLKKRSNIPAKTVVITFDDGNLNNFKNAFPILKKMDFPATIFMITDNIGKEGWLSEEDLRILDESGISIGSHTAHHAYLPDLDEEMIDAELVQSKARLEDLLGHPVTLFSYPAGGATQDIADHVKATGYAGAVTTNYGKGRRDAYRLHRIKIKDAGGNLFGFWLKVSGLYHLGKKRIEPGQ